MRNLYLKCIKDLIESLPPSISTTWFTVREIVEILRDDGFDFVEEGHVLFAFNQKRDLFDHYFYNKRYGKKRLTSLC